MKLFYDTEDCGCNGVVVILIVDGPNATDITFQTDPFEFLVDPQQKPLFDETLRLQADENYPSFKLSSDSNIYSSNIRIRDVRSRMAV
ncbi:iron-sulfur cluster biosynthesis family protein [Paenibacillus sp. P96]|uniref:Iron-sulfur cluster biosynthesis family protein n=1 Tax=Paenibacillus zeirhizosphaerae TaxID=2987519 RepID=A0ABT9FVD4_9BACL|nr:iron-sulfur cluster biosynthesis family protein [Paenibacillus sp. P96]MDP4098689.1 iron-sulfur cluster biosynthesis family protein [Paenibacillus sp. P96]